MIKEFIESKKFQNFIISLIILNGITLGLGTSKSFMADYGSFIELLDKLIIAVFTVEIILRIFVHRLSFFKDPWSLFDFFVVILWGYIFLLPYDVEFSYSPCKILNILFYSTIFTT